jgi:hypothetical protein
MSAHLTFRRADGRNPDVSTPGAGDRLERDRSPGSPLIRMGALTTDRTSWSRRWPVDHRAQAAQKIGELQATMDEGCRVERDMAVRATRQG